MFKIGRLYHLTHVVGDLDATDAWYDDIFCALRVYRNRSEVVMRDASVVVIGNCIIEAVQPTPLPGSERFAIGKYHARFGQHMHSIAMFADNLPELGNRLLDHGVRLSSTYGEPITERRPARTMWTHPKDTHALLEFAAVPRFHWDPRLHPSWSADYWRQHPLGITELAHVTVLFRDVTAAHRIYGDILGGQLLHTEELPGERKSAFFSLGPEVVIEALQPLSAVSVEGKDLACNGEGILGLTFRVNSIHAAAECLKRQGQRILERDSKSITLDPTCSFGMVVGFTERKIASVELACKR